MYYLLRRSRADKDLLRLLGHFKSGMDPQGGGMGGADFMSQKYEKNLAATILSLRGLYIPKCLKLNLLSLSSKNYSYI